MTIHRITLVLFSLPVALTGCASMTQGHEAEQDVPEGEMNAWLSDKPDQAERLYTMVPLQGERNRVLNQMRAGLAAFELGHWGAAERSFDDALKRIETIYADTPEARAARSNFTKENVKDFKGEPYERAMAYYYRGLLYLREGDYENARASFRGGLLQDTMAEDKEFSQDFGALAYLDGWASRCNGDDQLAGRSFAEATQHQPELRPPEGEEAVLVIYESGYGPIKGAVGEHREQLAIAEGPQTDGLDTVRVRSEQYAESVPLAEDLFWQATTRGGRTADDIMAAKAEFKEGMEGASLALTTGGFTAMNAATYANDTDVAAAGAAVAVAGAVAGLISDATRPEADDRYWDNLPGRIWMTAVPDNDQNRYTIHTGQGTPVEVAAFGQGECRIAWTREHSALEVPDRAPNSSAEATTVAGGVEQ